VDLRTQDNLTTWSEMIQTADHGQPLEEEGFTVLGQIGQVFKALRYPLRNHEKHRTNERAGPNYARKRRYEGVKGKAG
jgi:hypothetical protein